MSKKIQNKIKTEWDLKQLYKSVEDSQIDLDISAAEKAYLAFAKKYTKRTDYLKNEHALAHALKDYEELNDIASGKAYRYLQLSQDLNSNDEKVRAKMNLVLQRLQKNDNIINFFSIGLSKVPLNIQKKFLKSTKLAKYKYLLLRTFESGKYTLSEPEEKILSLKSLPAHSLWVQSFEKIENKQTIQYKGKATPISIASSLSRELPTQKERLDVHKQIIEVYKRIADSAESELNAIVIDKKINDELRGFKEPFDATIMGYENDRETILNLVKTVSDNFPLSQKFYAIKAKMLKLKKLNYSDRAVSVGRVKKKFTFEESYEILRNLFTRVDPFFGNILESYVQNGQIDAFPKVGKPGGAYCAPAHKVPTFVLLNHNDSMDSLRTFAHEMGHAIHGELSSRQPVYYEGYSMSVAETASTLFESFLFYDRFNALSDAEKIVALHDKISDDVSTIFRQIAFFNFEVEMHNTIREKGNMTKEQLVESMNKHIKSYMGNALNQHKDDGYIFAAIPHIRNFFYVYSYAFGQLASKALYEKYAEDKIYIEKIKTFLSAGGSMSPEDIFKSIGVDVKKPDFWKLGIKSIEDDINLLEKLVNKK